MAVVSDNPVEIAPASTMGTYPPNVLPVAETNRHSSAIDAGGILK